MLLNKRLKRLKADEHSLKATIGELITATEIAERAIGGLKHTVRDVNENLGTQLASATADVGAAEETARRVRQRGSPACPRSRSRRGLRPKPTPEPAPVPAPASVSSAKAVAAAAQAFSDRRKANGLAA